MGFLFVDLDPTFIDAMTALGYDARCCDITAVHAKPRMYYVSPANAFGFMWRGINAVYDQWVMPGIAARVQTEIQAREIAQTEDDLYYHLPIGKAIIVDHLIVAPTVYLPDSVGTHNAAFLAFTAVLRVMPIGANIVCPGMCTGTVSGAECAAQIHRAFVRYTTRRSKRQ